MGAEVTLRMTMTQKIVIKNEKIKRGKKRRGSPVKSKIGDSDCTFSDLKLRNKNWKPKKYYSSVYE